jgi:hypothetical protein
MPKGHDKLLSLTREAEVLGRKLAVSAPGRTSATTIKSLNKVIGEMRYVLVKQKDYRPPGGKPTKDKAKTPVKKPSVKGGRS